MVKYFFKPAKSVNEDIERHRKEEQKLLKLISECANTEMGTAARNGFLSILAKLEQSKAEAVNKLGRK